MPYLLTLNNEKISINKKAKLKSCIRGLNC